MATYTHHYSRFPEEVYIPHNFKDAENETVVIGGENINVGNLISHVRNLLAEGNFSQAKYYIEQNKTVLEPYVLNAEHINMIEEETRNCEVYAISRQQAVFYSDEEPEYSEDNDVWITSEGD